MPAVADGPLQFHIMKDGVELKALDAVKVAAGTTLYADVAADQVCLGVEFIDAADLKHQGQRDCSASQNLSSVQCGSETRIGCVASEAFPAIDTALLRNNPRFSNKLTLAGIQGQLADCVAMADDCSIDSYSLIAQPLQAVDMRLFIPGVIKAGSALFGVTGTLPYSPPPCGLDGATNCLSSFAFPSVNHSYLEAQKSKIRSALAIGGVVGTLHDCLDNATNCYLPAFSDPSQMRKAVDISTLIASHIKSGVTIANVSGTLDPGAADCTLDNQTNCLANTLRPAVDKNLADANKEKFDLSITVGGVTGTLATCASDGATSCTTTSAFPAIDKSNYDSNKAAVSSTVSVAGIAGTLADCIANSSLCLLPAYAAGVQDLKAISYDSLNAANIKVGATIGGVAGTLQQAPAICASDSETNCIASANFFAADKNAIATNQGKIPLGLTLAGIAGTLSGCNGDGQTSCVALSNYPAFDLTYVQTNKAKFTQTLTVAGVAGTLDNCNASGQTTCVAIAAFPAFDKDRLNTNKAKLLDSLTYAGVTGTIANCAANASSCYVAPYGAITQPLKAINYDSLSSGVIKLGTLISDITGSVEASPAVCGADGATGCVTDGNFPAMDLANATTFKAKIHDSIAVAGITGTLVSCNSSNQSNCLSSATYPSFVAAVVTSNLGKIRVGVTIAGSTGTLAPCAAHASNCYLSAYSAGSQSLRAINFDLLNSTIIKSGSSIAGISGSVIEQPSACAANAQTDCLAISTFPALNKAYANSNKALFSTGINAGGVVGTMAVCNSDGTTSCLADSTFPALQASYVNSKKQLIGQSVTVAGVAGALANCSAQGSGCFLPSYAAATQPLKAISYDDFSEGVIKKSTVLAGLTGAYPSSSYPLAPGDALSDLTAATFGAKLTSSTSFGWFTRDGTRLSHAGDAAIVAGNLRKDLQVFGVTGSFAVPDPWDLRYGVSAGAGVSGRLRTQCRNSANLSIFDGKPGVLTTLSSTAETFTATAHGFAQGDLVKVGYVSGGPNITYPYYVRFVTPNTFKLALANNDTTINLGVDASGVSVYRVQDNVIDWSDTIDRYNNGGAATLTADPWTSVYRCDGVDTTGTSTNVWKDVTTGGCTAGAAACRFKDQITNLEWTKKIGTGIWADAIVSCENLVYDGEDNWRLPTQYEVSDAISHGIASAVNSDWITSTELNAFIAASTSRAASPTVGWYKNSKYGNHVRGLQSTYESTIYMCVRVKGEIL